MPRVGFEPTMTAFHRAKTVHALDREATVIGFVVLYQLLYLYKYYDYGHYPSLCTYLKHCPVFI
jgi:hypothetical protein